MTPSPDPISPRASTAQNPSRRPYTYTLSFMALGLRPELARIMAELYLQEQSWEKTRTRIRAQNALQCRNQDTADRIERALRPRLETLTLTQLSLLSTAVSEECAALCWLSTMKHSRFALEFAAEVLRDKLAQRDPVLRYSDFEEFLEQKALLAPELANISPDSRNRVRKTLYQMLVEAGLLIHSKRTVGLSAQLIIQRPLLSPSVLQAIVSDHPVWLAGFLVPDDELGGYQRW